MLHRLPVCPERVIRYTSSACKKEETPLLLITQTVAASVSFSCNQKTLHILSEKMLSDIHRYPVVRVVISLHSRVQVLHRLQETRCPSF